MEIEEEVARKRQTIEVEDADQAYPELRDLLINRLSFDHVSEEKYFNDVEEGEIRTKIETEEEHDKYTHEELEIYFQMDKATGKADIQIKAILVTEYPDDHFYQDTIWYYGYRSLFDKFLYGEVRHGYVPDAEEKADTVLSRIRETIER